MMLLMGMKMSLTKNPTKPMTMKPIAVRVATLVNSASHTNQDRAESVSDLRRRTTRLVPPSAAVRRGDLPLRSGLWQRLTRRTLSLAKSRRGSTTESIASIAAERDLEGEPRERGEDVARISAVLPSGSLIHWRDGSPFIGCPV
jgi:hypothetical protein